MISLGRNPNAPQAQAAPEPKKSVLHITVFGGRVTIKDLVLFSRQLAVMIGAGVPIVQALQSILRQIHKDKFRNVLTTMIHDIRDGDSLSAALSKHPKVFSPFILGVVTTGEASGQLVQSLTTLADHLEQDYAFWRKFYSALAYPILILVSIAVVTVIVFTQVVPQLARLFEDAKVELPLPTRIVVGIATFFQNYWYLLIGLGIVFVFIGRSYIRTPEGRYTVSTLALRTPVIRGLFQKVYLARLTSILHTLLKSDVPILESLALARQAMGNRVYQRIMTDTIRAVQDGAPISTVWEHEPFIPPMLSTIVSVGEKSGQVADAFQEANRFFKRDVEEILNTITVLLEPIMVILLGIGVAIIVSAVLLPIYNLVLVL